MTTMEKKEKKEGRCKYLCCQVVNLSCWNLWMFQKIHYWLLLILDLTLFCKILNYLITNNCERQWWKAHEYKKLCEV